MIGLLLELAAFQMALDSAYRNAAKKAYRKYVWSVRDQYAQFCRWAEKNPPHALVQRVWAEMLALNQSLTISPAKKGEQALVIAQNAYLLLTQLPQWNNNNWYTNCWQLNR